MSLFAWQVLKTNTKEIIVKIKINYTDKFKVINKNSYFEESIAYFLHYNYSYEIEIFFQKHIAFIKYEIVYFINSY